MKYQVTIKTGDQAPSGTNSDIKLKIIGTKGETEFCELDHFFHDDFQHGTTETYNIVGDDVGDVECLSIYAKPMIIERPSIPIHLIGFSIVFIYSPFVV